MKFGYFGDEFGVFFVCCCLLMMDVLVVLVFVLNVGIVCKFVVV